MDHPFEVDLIWGIGNRVNGLLNGLILSHHLQRPARFRWLRGPHCRAGFGDVFDASSGWVERAGFAGTRLVEAQGEGGLVLAQTLFCAPLNPVTRKVHAALKGLGFEAYTDAYGRLWREIRWSPKVHALVPDRAVATAAHFRTQWRNSPYRPPLEAELAAIGRGAFVACDSRRWTNYLRVKLPGSFGLQAGLGDTDLARRDAEAIVAAAADLVTISRAERLFVHAPEGSTFFVPATFGASVPTFRIAWRSCSPRFVPDVATGQADG